MRKLKNEELNRLNIHQYKSAEKWPFVIVLDNVRSLNNVGSVFRTADAFKAEKIFLCGITGTPPHNEIHKSALGAENAVDWEYCKQTSEAVDKLHHQGYQIVSLEQVENSLPLNLFIPDKNLKYAFVFGNEIRGVDQEIVNKSDFCIEIPQFGTKHSFNIAVSVGMVLWQYYLGTGK